MGRAVVFTWEGSALPFSLIRSESWGCGSGRAAQKLVTIKTRAQDVGGEDIIVFSFLIHPLPTFTDSVLSLRSVSVGLISTAFSLSQLQTGPWLPQIPCQSPSPRPMILFVGGAFSRWFGWMRS